MIVVYTSILEHIRKLKEAAEAGGRDIEYLVLTEGEVRELSSTFNEHVTYNKDGVMGTVLGIQIVGINYHIRMRRDAREDMVGS